MKICSILGCEKGSLRTLERWNRPNPMKIVWFRLQIGMIWFAVLRLIPGQISESIHTKLIDVLGPWTPKAQRNKPTISRHWEALGLPGENATSDAPGMETDLVREGTKGMVNWILENGPVVPITNEFTKHWTEKTSLQALRETVKKPRSSL